MLRRSGLGVPSSAFRKLDHPLPADAPGATRSTGTIEIDGRPLFRWPTPDCVDVDARGWLLGLCGNLAAENHGISLEHAATAGTLRQFPCGQSCGPSQPPLKDTHVVTPAHSIGAASSEDKASGIGVT